MRVEGRGLSVEGWKREQRKNEGRTLIAGNQKYQPSTFNSQPSTPHGMVLVLVLIVIALLALAGYTFSELMLTEHQAVMVQARAIQARALTDSGVALAEQFLTLEPQALDDAGGVYDNPTRFQAVLVTDDGTPRGRGRFSVLAPLTEEGEGAATGIRFGLEDESARLNLNALLYLEEQAQNLESLAGGAAQSAGDVEGTGGATGGTSGGTGGTGSGSGQTGASGGQSGSAFGGSGSNQTSGSGNSDASDQGGSSSESTGSQDNVARELLMGLPGMTEDIADAILDWIDEDDDPREYGAEIEYYSGLVPAYAPKNGPLETVEELLLIRGVTPGLLFGADVNRNGMLDAHEQGAGSIDGVDNSDGSLDRGWSAYLTLYSMEKNLQPDGTPRIDVNSNDLEALYDDLSAVLDADAATFIIAYRQSGPYTGRNTPTSVSGSTPNFETPGQTKLSSVLDLLVPAVEATLEGSTTPVVMQNPFGADPVQQLLIVPTLMDHLTVNPSPTIPGRISINQAPRTILMGIRGMTDLIIEQIMSRRQPNPAEAQESRQHETWLLTEAIVTLDEMKQLMPFVTSGGSVYRAQVVGYFDEGGPPARVEVVIDATPTTPQLLFWRDLSHLGRGHLLETLGVQAQ